MSKTAVAEMKAEASLCCDIYRNAKMGSEAILNLLPSVNDTGLESELTLQLSRYEEFAREAKEILEKNGEKPLEESAFSRLMAKMGIKMNTMIDKTSSHIAQMVIEGAVMGITDIQKRLNEADDYGDAEPIARRLMAFEEDTVERMKAYL
ncbi:MAG: hypothetical protein IJW79_04190 [Clostridia bacterium]|nr:hypothetical protein [Clostridia bacterium]